MKGIICYYSGSGNTKLAINYIKNKTKNADFELYDIVRSELPDLSEYDIIGFATFTDFWGVPQYFCSFFDEIAPQPNKYAFVFNTFGFISGKTLKHFAKLAQSKEFNVLCGHSLHTPESYLPMRSRNRTYDTSPNPKELKKAVQLDSNPVFDHRKCNGCWSCYNHCPEGAIYTAKFKGEGQYPKPSKELKSKLALE